MALKKHNPTSPGRRFASTPTFDEITKSKPERSLIERRPNTDGRNNTGRVTVRHRGGGHKKIYRRVDFRRDKFGVPAKVAAIEYDPNRSCRIALLHYADGEKRYILAPLGVTIGTVLNSGPDAEIRPGNALPIASIPVGSTVHNIELTPGRGGQMVRSAGASAQLLAKDENYCHLRLPSGEVRRVLTRCMATMGQLGNLDHENQSVGKAGRNRWKGWRPTVRGATMNPNDHPHGGGEGKTGPGGNPKTPWGKPAMGFRTRRNKSTDKFIVRRRGK